MFPSLHEKLAGVLGDGFRVERELGGAGMSRVFVARDLALGRRVAVKVLPPELTTDLSIDRFRREILIAARLQHPNIVPVLDAGVGQDIAYYTMPFVEGETLRHHLKRDGLATTTPMSIEAVVRMLQDVLRAVSYAHRHGVVHRDIKPENILLSDGAAVVTDFGIAKAMADSLVPALHASTEPGVGIGTAAYVAPEQAAGDPATDHRADLYSIGVLAYELLSGSHPFAGRTRQQLIAAHALAPPVSVAVLRPDTPAPLADVVMRCLAKAAGDRPQSAEEVRSILASIIDGPARAPRRLGAAIMATLVLAAGLVAVSLRLVPSGARAVATTVALRPSATAHANVYLIDRFENATGDSTLDILGDLAADFLGRELGRVRGLVVIPPQTAYANARIVDGIPWFLRPFQSRQRLRASESGAGTVISGRFYYLGDSLRLHTVMTDYLTGSLTQAFVDVAVPRSADPALLIGPLQQAGLERIVPVAALLGDTAVVTPSGAYSDPPTLEAYREMYAGIEAYFRNDTSMYRHYRNAESADTNWATPTVLIAYPDAWNGRVTELAKDLARGRRLASRMTPAERAFYDYATALNDADLQGALRAAQTAMAALPGSMEGPLLVSSTALGMHRTDIAAKALARSDPDRGLNLVSGYWWVNRIGLDQELGHGAAVIATARAASARLPDWPGTILFQTYEVRELVAQGAPLTEVDHAIATARMPARRDGAGSVVIAAQAATAMKMHGRDALADSIARAWWPRARLLRADTTRWVQESVANLAVLAGQWGDLASFADGFNARAGRAYFDRLSYSAVARLHLADTAGADRIDALLRAAHPRHLDFGFQELQRARIAAHRGDRSAARALLVSAVDEGVCLRLPWGVDFASDAFLVPLHDDFPTCQR